MNKDLARQLIDKYLKGDCTPEEQVLLERFYLQQASKKKLPVDSIDFELKKKEIWQKILKDTLPQERRKHKLFVRIAVAATVLILCTLGIDLYLNKKTVPQPIAAISKADFTPGTNKAILTLADGSKIILDDANDGEIAKQSGITISKTSGGQLIYTISKSANTINSSAHYNTIETPRGGQYQVNLPDGSKVWLNAASSLRYPIVFAGNDRQVELTGEGYFEVAKNKAKPFKVIVNKSEIEVLGTHFNVMAYADEKSINTTLIEGSVRVRKGGSYKVLVPGQQARVDEKIEVATVDVQDAMAWKNGFFIFKSKDIEGIMRELSRWYNVDVDYQGPVRAKTFVGKISRNRNVSEVLKVLELTGSVRFKIEERRITVMQ